MATSVKLYAPLTGSHIWKCLQLRLLHMNAAHVRAAGSIVSRHEIDGRLEVIIWTESVVHEYHGSHVARIGSSATWLSASTWPVS